MNFPGEIKKIRQSLFMTQEDFAKEIGVAFSTVNRWEGGKSKPNLNAMKNIKEFCFKHDIDFSAANEAWLNYKSEV
ncbi:MAG: helix-turn-helix transcriptional regulator [Clostridiales bacterium]|jgi:putative transcriptional regulator|nr:helix-turn-helix transcriptional regulator [Clostridiales bacterium]